MNELTIKVDKSVKFTSTAASDCDEIFTAFQDHYREGYIIIDSSKRAYIIDNNVIEECFSDGTFKRVL
jgi:hypothetical protein